MLSNNNQSIYPLKHNYHLPSVRKGTLTLFCFVSVNPYHVVLNILVLNTFALSYRYIALLCVCVCVCVSVYIYIYRVSQVDCARLRKGVPYVKVYRCNPKHLCPNLNGYGDNVQRILKL